MGFWEGFEKRAKEQQAIRTRFSVNYKGKDYLITQNKFKDWDEFADHTNEKTPNHIPKELRSFLPEELRDANTHGHLLILDKPKDGDKKFDASAIKGYAYVHELTPKARLLGMIHIYPEHQRKGLGTMFLEGIRRSHGSHLTLSAQPRHNKPMTTEQLHAFYEKQPDAYKLPGGGMLTHVLGRRGYDRES